MNKEMGNTKKKRKKMKGLFIGLAAFFVIVIAALGFAGNYFCDFALSKSSDNGINREDENEETTDSQEKKAAKDWLLAKSEDQYIVSEDGLKLHAYEVTAAEDSNRYMILCHGYKGQALELAQSGQHFYENGFHLLMPDARAHGSSEGDYIGMGWLERRDIIQWIDRIVSKDPEAEIGLYGVSMGAATVMMTAGEEDLQSQVKVVVEDCGYTSVWSEFSYQLKEMFGLPSFPIMNAAAAVASVRADLPLKEASAVKQVAKSEVPMLFIHGDQDTFVPFEMQEEVYNAASGEKEKLVIPGAGHGEARSTDPDTYWKAIDGFVEKYISAVEH